TIGGANANSYVDVAAADLYFDDQLNSSKWTAASTADKTRALLMAANRLQIENWLGGRVKTTQRLAWPRLDVREVDPIGMGYGTGYGYGYGYFSTEYYRSDEIPQPVKDSQCEFALVFLSGGGGGVAAGTIESFTVDALSVKFAGQGATSAVDDSRAKALI